MQFAGNKNSTISQLILKRLEYDIPVYPKYTDPKC